MNEQLSNHSLAGPKVFLSYAHDDETHTRTVLELANFLETRGIAVEVDKWHEGSRRDWYAWMLREITSTDFVIVVASPAYREIGDGAVPTGTHRGVQAETAVLRDLLYRDRETWLGRVLPVVLPGRSLDELPTFTQPYSASHFLIDSITDEGADDLLRVVTGQPRHVRPARGSVPALPSRHSAERAPRETTRRAGAGERLRRLRRPIATGLRALPAGGWLALAATSCLAAMGAVAVLLELSWLAGLTIAATSLAMSIGVSSVVRRDGRDWLPVAWRIASIILVPLLAGVVVAFPTVAFPAAGGSIAGATAAGGLIHGPEGDDPARDGAPGTGAPGGHSGPSPRTSSGPTTTSGSNTGSDPTSSAESDKADESGAAANGSEQRSRSGSLEILTIGHSFAPGIDRLTVTTRNNGPDPVLVKRIEVYMEHNDHDWGDGGDQWHFSVPGDMYAGDAGDDGSRRTHGMITMSGTQFAIPVTGQGWFDGDSWHRLLAFDPQRFLPGSATTSIVIDIPTTLLIQQTSESQPAGPMVEVNFGPGGSSATHVAVFTPDGRAVACNYLGRKENTPDCDDIDTHAAVALPN